MKASLLIKQLEELIKEYGDLDVVGNEHSVSFVAFMTYVDADPRFEIWEETDVDE